MIDCCWYKQSNNLIMRLTTKLNNDNIVLFYFCKFVISLIKIVIKNSKTIYINSISSVT